MQRRIICDHLCRSVVLQFMSGLDGVTYMSNCKYCGNRVSAGGGCSKSPTKCHVVEIPGHCIYCGNKVNAGGGCSKSPHKTHEVNNGHKKCIYCGNQVNAGGSCSKSPVKVHVLGN